MAGNFLWADLSSYEPTRTRPFYSAVLGWRFDGYVAQSRRQPVAGLFKMPEKFAQMKLPPFWMSYISVDSIEQSVAIAKQLGGKVEIGPTPFDGGGQFALVRDPLGAGFTLYEGSALEGAAPRIHALFVSNAKAVQAFYTGLFGWAFSEPEKGVYAIRNHDRTIAHLHEIPDDAIRGPEEYWAVGFPVPNKAATCAKAVAHGGTIVADTDLPEGAASLIRDPDSAAFFLVEARQGRKALPWKALGGLALILLSLLSGWAWLWSVFLIIWVIAALRERTTWLFEAVSRDEHPWLYWGLVGLYSALAALSLWAGWT